MAGKKNRPHRPAPSGPLDPPEGEDVPRMDEVATQAAEAEQGVELDAMIAEEMARAERYVHPRALAALHHALAVVVPSPCIGDVVLYRGAKGLQPAIVVDVHPDLVLDVVTFHAPGYGPNGPQASTFVGHVPHGAEERTWCARPA